MRIGLLARGDREVDRPSDRAETLLAPLARAFAALGADVEPVAYYDESLERARDQLLGLDGVLVWVNPVQDGADRSRLDALLREVAGHGAWVSAHPEVILRLGTKEVLHTSRSLGWGCDTELYRTVEDLRQRFPHRLARQRVMVLKQGRGTGGAGVWKVELTDRVPNGVPTSVPELDAAVRVQHAVTRDTQTEETTLAEFLQACEGYFAWSGFLVDQPYQDRLADGMIRAYLVHDQVVGFQHQWPTGLLSADHATGRGDAPPASRGMEDPDTASYQLLRKKLESEWVPQMAGLLGLDRTDLPVIWDADFLYGPATSASTDTTTDTAGSADSYVLCEINVSAVWPYPEQAAAVIAQAAVARTQAAVARVHDAAAGSDHSRTPTGRQNGGHRVKEPGRATGDRHTIQPETAHDVHPAAGKVRVTTAPPPA